MKVEDIRLSIGELSDKVYAGRLNSDKTAWREKIDVSNDFLHAVIVRWEGITEKVTAGDGTQYEITVQKIDGGGN